MPLLGALAAAAVFVWIEYHRRRAQHLRAYWATGVLRKHAHRPGKRIDQG